MYAYIYIHLGIYAYMYKSYEKENRWELYARELKRKKKKPTKYLQSFLFSCFHCTSLRKETEIARILCLQEMSEKKAFCFGCEIFYLDTSFHLLYDVFSLHSFCMLCQAFPSHTRNNTVKKFGVCVRSCSKSDSAPEGYKVWLSIPPLVIHF